MSQTQSIKSECVGTNFERNGFTYKSLNALWKTEMLDYTIFTDDDFTPYVNLAPVSLKETIKSRWLYNMHIGQSQSSTINSHHLNQRVRGGEILAYKYAECIIEGNQAVYCGYIPTTKPNGEMIGTHTICRFSLQEIYPRRLYIHLTRKIGSCVCSFDNTKNQSNEPNLCTRWDVILYNGLKASFCSKAIDWNNIYVFMGEPDVNCKQFTKIPRDCQVCAQCYKCSIGAFYCRTHVICKHKKARVFMGENSHIAELIGKPKPKMKTCRKIKL